MLKNLFKTQVQIYKKIIVVFLALLTPLFALSLWINITGADYIRSEISKSVTSNLQFYSKQLDDEFARIKLQQRELMNSNDLGRISFLVNMMTDYEKTQTVNRLVERLGTVVNSSTYIKDAGIYVKSLNATISVKNGLIYIPNEEYLNLKKCFESKKSTYIYYYDDRMFLLEVKQPRNMSNWQDASIIIYTEISKGKIRGTLKNLVKYEDSGSIITDADSGFMIKSESDKTIVEKIMNLYQKHNTQEKSNFELKWKNHNYWVEYNELEYLNLTLFSYFPDSSVTENLKRYSLMFIILFSISIIIVVIFAFVTNIMIHKPLESFIKAFKTVDDGSLDISIPPRRNDEFGYLYKAFNSMVRKMKLSIEQNYEQKIALQQSELKQLQSQINPHFLYNCFYNINRMCKAEDVDTAAELSQKLGSYYRYVTRSGSDEVTLKQEFSHAMDYMDIQSIRFSNRIKVHVPELPEECRELLVPRIILQPILENAYEHAFEKNINGGNIHIQVTFENNILSIVIEDDGQALTDEALENLQKRLENPSECTEKTGIINVCRRLQIKYGEGSGLFASRSFYGGLRVNVLIRFGEGTKLV